MKCHIAIVIPVFNAEKYIAECLDCIIKQTYNDWEVICVNDGSTDNSQEILSHYSNIDPRIKVFYQKNSGASAARNFALKQISPSSTTWVSFVDADDYVSNTMYSDIVSALQETNAEDCDYVRLFCQQTTVRPTNSDITSLNPIKQPQLLTRDEYFRNGEIGGYTHSAFIKSTIISENCILFPEDMKVLEDQVFSINCALHSNKVLVYYKRNYFYYYNPNSVTKSSKNNSADIIRCINKLKKALQDANSTTINEYLHTKFLPIKTGMLINQLFRFKARLNIPLDSDIKISKYFRFYSFKTKFKYLILKFKKSI